MAGCWSSNRDGIEVHKLAKKRPRPISSHLDRPSLVNKGFIIWLLGNFSRGTRRVVPSGQDSPIGQPITARNLVHLARSRSQPYNNKESSYSVKSGSFAADVKYNKKPVGDYKAVTARASGISTLSRLQKQANADCSRVAKTQHQTSLVQRTASSERIQHAHRLFPASIFSVLRWRPVFS